MEKTKRQGGLAARSAKAAAWRQRIEQWRQSGLTQAAFCRQRNLALATFQWWRRRLNARGADTAAAVSAFVPVRLKETRADATAWHSPATWSCEVTGLRGVTIRLQKRPSAVWLGELVGALAETVR